MPKAIIRAVHAEDLDRIAEIEAACFPAAEAATRESFKRRIATFPDCFFVAETSGKIIGFINGCITNSPVIYDEMFHDSRHHIPDGENLSVFGLDVLPEHRKQGIAAELMNHFIQVAKNGGRKKVILTCKYQLVSYYESFGYVNDGLSSSTHGGAQWFDMTLTL
jgi:ribosomal protein S18 acetylase RimI-like enzyme